MVRDRQSKQFDSKKIMFLLKTEKKGKLESTLGAPNVTCMFVCLQQQQQKQQQQQQLSIE
jgi:hypothetical protein